MDFNEYLRARNQVIDPDYRYAAFRHTNKRLYERFKISGRYFPMRVWEQKSYACAKRFKEPIIRDQYANFFREDFFGKDVVWVYNRKQRCIVSAFTMDILMKGRSEEMQGRLDLLLEQWGAAS